jgi:hypothetical protein
LGSLSGGGAAANGALTLADVNCLRWMSTISGNANGAVSAHYMKGASTWTAIKNALSNGIVTSFITDILS